MSAERLDYQWRQVGGRSIKDSATIVRWWAAYYESMGQPTEASCCRKIADEVESMQQVVANA